MTCLGAHCVEQNPQLLSERLAAYLRRRTNAKGLAREIDCDPRTAENILAGRWPSARHWLHLSRAFGADLVEAVFSPQTAVERLEQEADELERRLSETRALAAEAAGFVPRPARSAAARPGHVR